MSADDQPKDSKESDSKLQRQKEREDDLKRSREFSDSFRRYLVAATSGGIAILFATAGSFASKDIDPRWIIGPVGCFVATLLSIGVALLMGEHQSLIRRGDPQAQEKMPRWKMGITWNLIPLFGLAIGVSWAVFALNSVDFAPKSGCASCSSTQRSDGNSESWACCSAASIASPEYARGVKPCRD